MSAFLIGPADRRALLDLARAALESAVLGGPLPAPAPTPVFAVARGAFVTLTLSRELRGCIGVPHPERPLGRVVVECAAAAALSDPRFEPVSPAELTRVSIELSVLTPPAPVGDPGVIVVGRHGLIVARGRVRGLLLPQVAAERGWNREEFLAQTCRKAGLPPDAWRQGAQVFAFEAEIFGEEHEDLERR